MVSSSHFKNASEKETGVGVLNLQTLNDLFLIELSQTFAQAIEAKILLPHEMDELKNTGIFVVRFCYGHQMVMSPTCSICDVQASRRADG